MPSEPQEKFVLPALTAGIQNQGLNNYVPIENATLLKNVITVSANGANTGATFFQNREFTILQDSYAIKWIYTETILSDNHYLFLVGAIKRAIYGNYEWTNKAGWERIKNNDIKLPIKDGKIDFDFMENFIAELEAQRIAELEAYLSVTGLKDTRLSPEEEQALKDYKTIPFEKYRATDVFTIVNTSNILSREVSAGSGKTPYLSASADNNSVSSYIKFDEKYLCKGNCVFIAGKTFVVSYQEQDFFSNDSHNLALYAKDNEKQNKLTQLFLSTCVNKSLGHKYSWGNSISKQKINKDYISLPKKELFNHIKMETIISAIQKLVIKDVVTYTDKKVATTRTVVGKK